MNLKLKVFLSFLFFFIVSIICSYWYISKFKNEVIIKQDIHFLLKKNISQKQILKQLKPHNIDISYLNWRIISLFYNKNFVPKAGEYLIPKGSSINDLQNLFQAVGVELGEETETIQNKVEVQIWDQFELQAEDAGSANLELKGGELVFTAIESKKIKKIDNGNSIFETIESEILYTISQQRSQGKKVGPFFKVLDEAKVKFQESMNGTLMIRKYTDLVIISDQLSAEGKTLLYPNVTIQFAGLAPLVDNTTIRFTEVELGEFVEEPESSIYEAGMPF